jgi:uncharacterized PurR-regulated membrane protein YhhQ (DUF165 family)
VAALEADYGPYRLRQGGDAVWPPVERAYGGPFQDNWHKAVPVLMAAAKLIVPVLLTLVLLGAAYLYADAVLPEAWLPQGLHGSLLTISDLVLPCTWLSIHLTNRRYGPAYAFAHLAAALALGLAIILVNPYDLDNWVNAFPALTARNVLCFGIAFFLANFVGLTVFDGARGARWWTAPLMGMLSASLVFSLVYYPAALAGIYAGWVQAALSHLLLFGAASVLLLSPYFLLRPAMRPLGGLNGY